MQNGWSEGELEAYQAMALEDGTAKKCPCCGHIKIKI